MAVAVLTGLLQAGALSAKPHILHFMADGACQRMDLLTQLRLQLTGQLRVQRAAWDAAAPAAVLIHAEVSACACRPWLE